jgi:hypothetical protein
MLRTFCAIFLLAAPAASQQAATGLEHLPLGTPHTTLDGLPLAEKYADSAARILGRSLISHQGLERLSILCDEVGARLSGSPGADRAVEWCQERLRDEGFANVRAEPVMVPRWVRGSHRVRMTAPYAADLAACALGGSIGTPEGPITGSVVAVSSFRELRELGQEQVQGKIVLFNRAMKRNGGSMNGYGAVVSLRTQGARSVGTDQARLPHTGAMNYQDDVPRIPAIAVAGEDADQIQRMLDRGTEVVLSIELGCQTLDDYPSANVVAEFIGRESPDEIILVGGHLDSWDLGTGALDDGAGCMIAWEAVRLLMELGLQPRRTIRLVLFMNEENGLRGGFGYAETHAAEVEKHICAIEADSGAGRPLGFRAGMDKAAIPAVEEIAQLLQGIGADAIQVGGSGGADISPLYRKGVPCMGLRQDVTYYFDYHHTAADTFDKVGPFELSLSIASMSIMTYVLAEMETSLRDRIADS